MKNKLAQIEFMVAEFIGTKNFTICTKDIVAIETEILWELNSRQENQNAYYLNWNLRLIEKNITSVLRKCSSEANISGKKLLLTLVNLYEEIMRCFNPVPLELKLMVVILRKQFRKYRDFSLRFGAFLKQLDIPEALADIALSPIFYFQAKNLGDKFEFGKSEYLQQYATVLNLIMRNGSKPKLNLRAFLSHMIELNLNHPALRAYICDLINERLKKSPGNELHILKGLKRDLKQLDCDGRMAFDPQYKLLRDSLCDWICLESKVYKQGQSIIYQNRERFKLKLPVSQIACLSKLYHRQDVFHEMNNNKVVDHYINSYSSKETEQMSENSFKNHFKKISPAAAKSVAVLLTNMLNDLKENFY